MKLEPGARIALEEAAARAWPARETLARDGWLLRFSGGGSKRANSTLTLAWKGADVEARLDAVKDEYRRREQTPIFSIVDISQPADLDARLAARGYALVEPTLLMLKSVSSSPRASPLVRRHADAPSEWLDVYFSAITSDRRRTAPDIIARLPSPRCFFVADVGGEAAAVGLGVAEGRYCGIECMATREAARRSGGARAILTDLEAWADGQGAETLWLQVLRDNSSARRLYDATGFESVGSYHYRVGPAA